MKGILGRKLGMTQVFTKSGEVIPVTVIEIMTNYVLKVLTKEHNGYDAVQLATEPKRKNLVNKPDNGQFKHLKIAPQRFVQEIRNMDGYEVGTKLDANCFTPGEFVDTTAVSKGKGFSGVIKRYNFSRGPMGHGSGYHRGIGSMGSMRPKRVFKNKKMPGQHGHKQVTMQNLEVIAVNKEQNYLLVRGSTPGAKKQLVTIKSSIKQKQSVKPVDLLVREQPNKVTQKLNKPLVVKKPKVTKPVTSVKEVAQKQPLAIKAEEIKNPTVTQAASSIEEIKHKLGLEENTTEETLNNVAKEQTKKTTTKEVDVKKATVQKEDAHEN